MERSNLYIVSFAAAICLVCSVVVSLSAVALKDIQDANAILDRQKKVLAVAGLIKDGAEVSADDVQRIFETSIRARVVDLDTGEYAEGVDPTAYDQQRALKDPALSEPAPDNRAGIARLPKMALVYLVVGADEDIEEIVLPIEGKGLWSTLYGFLALAPDTTTIKGITFYQHGETPGLGGEVDNPSWKALWTGRQAYDETWETAIQVLKGAAGPVDEDPHSVDGLSGATLTARGVSELVRFWLGEHGFGPYLESFRNAEGSVA